MKYSGALEDWQDKEIRAPGTPASIGFALEINLSSVVFTDEVGRSIGIELQDGRLRVHVYSETKAVPVNLDIVEATGIEIERTEYDAAPALS